MRWIWPVSGLSALAILLGSRRVVSDRHVSRVEADLLHIDGVLPTFTETDIAGLPEPAQRYLRHAIALRTPLAPVCQIEMDAKMTPSPNAAPADLRALETLAPRKGFVWTAQSRMNGLPVRVRDFYYRKRGGVSVTTLGIVPIPFGGDPDLIARSARGRLIAEGMWCPTALVHPDVSWTAIGDDQAGYTLSVDGVSTSVALRIDEVGALEEVTLDRWGNPDGKAWRFHPYGFKVDAEGTFDGITIPTQLTGGWDYGTDAYDPTTAASFTVRHAEFALPKP